MLISSLGGVIYPIIFHKLQPRVGFAWATRTLAFIMLATLALPLLGMKLRGKTPSPKRGLDLSAWKEVSYTLFACSALFGFLGIYIPFFYVQLYALQQGTVNGDFVFYLLPLLNTGSLFGRLVGNPGRLTAYNQVILRVIADSSLYCRQVWPLEYRHGVHIICFSICLCLDQNQRYWGNSGVLPTFRLLFRRLRITGTSRYFGANSGPEIVWCASGYVIYTCCNRRSHWKSYRWGDSRPWMERFTVILWYHDSFISHLYDGGKDI